MVVKNQNGIAPYVLEPRTCKLQFDEDHQYHGIVIKARLDIDLKTFLELQELSTSEEVSNMRSAFRKFGDDIVIEWNIHDETGQEVEANAVGFLSLPPSLCSSIIESWATSVSAVGKV